MFQSVFNNKKVTFFERKEQSNKKLIKLGNRVLANVRFGLNRNIDRVEYIKLLRVGN